MAFVNGAPWSQQYSFNTTQSGYIDSITWTAGTSLSAATAFAAVVFVKGYVHIIGGKSAAGTFRQSIYRASVNASGVIGTWSPQTFSIERSNAPAVVVGQYVYLVGGLGTGNARTAEILRATLASDGTLGSFSAYGVSLPAARDSHCAAVIKNKLYVFGGNLAAGTTDSVIVADIDTNGDLGSFSSANNLSYAVDFASILVTSSRVYLVGGRNTSGTALSSLQYATINGNGTLGSWSTDSNQIAFVQWGATCVTVQDRSYNLGGRNASAAVDTISQPDFDANGYVTDASNYSGMTTIRHAAQSIITSSRLYVIGGINSAGTYVSTTEYIAFSGGANDYTSRLTEADATTVDGLSEQPEPECSGLAEVLNFTDGLSEQVAPECSGTGSAAIGAIFQQDQAAPVSWGFSYDGPYGSYGYGDTVAHLPFVKGVADNLASVGFSFQAQPEVSGQAYNPQVAFGGSVKWLPRVSGFAYTGNFIASIEAEQSVPASVGTATTWNTGAGLTVQPSPDVSGVAFTQMYRTALGVIEQGEPAVSATAIAGTGAVFTALQPEGSASGVAHVSPVCFGNAHQEPASCQGFALQPPMDAGYLQFARDNSSPSTTTTNATPGALLSFDRGASGAPVVQQAQQQQTPLSFTR